MASVLTCITCKITFKEPNNQRQHYKSDWHRYNLKRKVAELAPVTAEEFQRRLSRQKDLDAEKQKDKSVYCTACRRNFVCARSYENHLRSKKHKEKKEIANQSRKQEAEPKKSEPKQKIKPDKKKPAIAEAAADTDSDVEDVSSEEWNRDDENNPINKNNCLFCSHHSSSLVINLKHMTEAHTFFVPDIEYCIDLKGMLLYLGSKIVHGHLCLWCNEKSKTFHSVEAVQKHMIDKGHTKIFYEGEALLEYTSYYDYSSSYPDHKDKDPNEEVDIPTLDDSGYQLVLPSGSVIGHRSLMRYYKQNLNPKSGVLVKHKVSQVLSSYKKYGYTPLQKEIAQRRARDIQFMARAQQKFLTRIGVKANKLQQHFRPQVSF